MLIKILTLALSQLYCLNIANSKIVPKIIGGQPTDIAKFPHSVFISTILHSGSFVCGGSILNQRIVLTAAHCVSPNYVECYVFTQHKNKFLGRKYTVAAVKQHEDYQDKLVAHDIGLVMVKRQIKLNRWAQRVSLADSLPYRKKAAMAGWGLINEVPEETTNILHEAEMEVWTNKECRKFMNGLPDGCICAGAINEKKSPYPSKGDSGSALIEDGYIQIGLVSYKKTSRTSIVAFTSIPYYYSWIKRNSQRLFCDTIEYIA